MRRYTNQTTKVGRFLARNKGQLWRGLRREVATKLLQKALIRKIVCRFVRPVEPESWVFLVGCYNSGTTILREILEAHPEVAAMPLEGVRLTSAFPDLEHADWPRMMFRFREDWALPDEGAASRVAQAKRDWAPWWGRDARVYLEKSIDHTTRMKWLAKHFGKVRFIAITRNGYAVCEGVLRRSAPRDSAILEVGKSYTPEMVGAQWVAFESEIANNYTQGRDIHLSYEALIADPVPILQDIFNMLNLSMPGMSYDDGVLKVASRSFLLVDQNEVSIARLSQPQRQALGQEMQDQLTKCGYEVLDR